MALGNTHFRIFEWQIQIKSLRIINDHDLAILFWYTKKKRRNLIYVNLNARIIHALIEAGSLIRVYARHLESKFNFTRRFTLRKLCSHMRYRFAWFIDAYSHLRICRSDNISVKLIVLSLMVVIWSDSRQTRLNYYYSPWTSGHFPWHKNFVEFTKRETEREKQAKTEMASIRHLKLGIARKCYCTAWYNQIRIPVCLHSGNRVDETVGNR